VVEEVRTDLSFVEVGWWVRATPGDQRDRKRPVSVRRGEMRNNNSAAWRLQSD